MNLTQEQQKTFEDLQKPTMALIGSFYEIPAQAKGIFEDVMAIYEANPTEENAKALSDRIKEHDSAEDKKKWIKETVAAVSPMTRSAAKKKYIDAQQAVPKGVPTSGMLLCGLDFVSKAEKDALMEAQAAARLISHVDVLDKYAPKTNYQNADGSFENAFLDKPFATKMQRLEHLVNALVNDSYTEIDDSANEDNKYLRDGDPYLAEENYIIPRLKAYCQEDIFLQKARNEALGTLRNVAKKLEKTNSTGAERIANLADAMDVAKGVDVEKSLSEFAKIESFYGNILKTVSLSPSFGWPTGLKAVQDLNEDLTRLLNVRKVMVEPLTKEDYAAMEKQVAGRPIEGLVKHRVGQILATDAARQAVLAKNKVNG